MGSSESVLRLGEYDRMRGSPELVLLVAGHEEAESTHERIAKSGGSRLQVGCVNYLSEYRLRVVRFLCSFLRTEEVFHLWQPEP